MATVLVSIAVVLVVVVEVAMCSKIAWRQIGVETKENNVIVVVLRKKVNKGESVRVDWKSGIILKLKLELEKVWDSCCIWTKVTSQIGKCNHESAMVV